MKAGSDYMLQGVEVVCLLALRLMNNYFSYWVWRLKIIVHDARCNNLCARIVLISMSIYIPGCTYYCKLFSLLKDYWLFLTGCHHTHFQNDYFINMLSWRGTRDTLTSKGTSLEVK